MWVIIMSDLYSTYWKINLKIIALHLLVWFVISFGFGIIGVEWLNHFSLGGFKLGNWFASQGAIIGFVIILFSYAMTMKRVEAKLGSKSSL